jgi:hypothetical protein
MKISRHIVIVAVGAMAWGVLSFFLIRSLPQRLAWYTFPITLPVRVASLFGSGGEDLNVTAGDVAWASECLFFGAVVDGAFLLFRRKKAAAKLIRERQ